MPTVKQDSNFATSIMEVAVNNDVSKMHVAKAAEKLKSFVITPIMVKLNKNEALLDYEKQVLDFLASEHSSDGMQWGGAMPELPKSAILADKESLKALLSRLSERMTTDTIMGMTATDELAGVIKAITDCSFTYVERFPKHLRGEKFDYIKDMITPTPEELAIRVPRTELGEAEHRALSFGIGTEVGQDIAPVNNIPMNTERVHKAGKAAFAMADVFKRAEIVAAKYDQQVQRVNNLESLNDLSAEELEELDEAQKTLKNLTKQMEFYRVPLNSQKRPVNFKELNIPQPSIQKLARFGGTDGSPLPLIATASGTTARALIALHDLKAFNDGDNNFEPESAQYLSTLLCGTIVHGGHHSVLEVGEMYNRLLDCQAIDDLDYKGKRSSERTMGYYEIGNSGTLVPEAMRQAVLAKYNAKNQADIKRELRSRTNQEPDSPSPPETKYNL